MIAIKTKLGAVKKWQPILPRAKSGLLQNSFAPKRFLNRPLPQLGAFNASLKMVARAPCQFPQFFSIRFWRHSGHPFDSIKSGLKKSLPKSTERHTQIQPSAKLSQLHLNAHLNYEQELKNYMSKPLRDRGSSLTLPPSGNSFPTLCGPCTKSAAAAEFYYVFGHSTQPRDGLGRNHRAPSL